MYPHFPVLLNHEARRPEASISRDRSNAMSPREDSPIFLYPRLARAVFALAGLLLGFLVARAFVIPCRVSDDLMLPGLEQGRLVYVLKHVTPREGDIVLVESPAEPGKTLLRRVIAGEGAVIEVRNKVFYNNGEKMTFTWETLSTDNRVFPMSFSGRDNMAAVKLDRKAWFLLCDNLDREFDSRTLGPVEAGRIIGRVIYR
ncbi:MAG: signal peptidase I [Spirochaetes bacterium]|nr:MAG: signal peptidase I [Spirochaetota bacterium]